MPASLSEVLLGHRSIRTYKPDPIDRSLVEAVCAEAIAGSSSSGNLNSVSLILTTDPERKKWLYEIHGEQEMILQAPLAITFCADWWKTREWLRLRDARDNFDNFLGFMVSACDAMILSQSVCLGFEQHGLGICYMGTTLFEMQAIADYMELPETCLPITTIVVGHPNENPAKRDRLPLDAWLFDEKYRRPDSSDIDRIYKEREVKGWQRYMAMPDMQKMATEHGITSLAQFYTSEIKYSPEFFAEISVEMLEALKNRKFLD